MVHNNWKQGQHVTIIAPTEGGKSVFAVKGLLPMWQYTLTLDAKGEDKTLARSGKKVKQYPTWQRYRDSKFWLLLPPDQPKAAQISHHALRHVFKHKQWTVYVDELRLFTDRQYLPRYQRGLPAELERLWLYGRSRGITLVTGTQAPRFIPAAAYEQARHFFIGNVRDDRAVKRLGEISGDVDLIRGIVPTLEPFEFLYVGPAGMGISKYPLKERRVA
jgi:hypothetical protein